MKTLKQIIELYSEPDRSTFTHDGSTYDLNGLLSYTLGMNRKMLPVASLKWILKWDRVGGARVRNADLTAPILVVDWKGKLVVVDGVHRLTKAVRSGVKELPSIFVSDSVLEKFRLS